MLLEAWLRKDATNENHQARVRGNPPESQGKAGPESRFQRLKFSDLTALHVEILPSPERPLLIPRRSEET